MNLDSLSIADTIGYGKTNPRAFISLQVAQSMTAGIAPRNEMFMQAHPTNSQNTEF